MIKGLWRGERNQIRLALFQTGFMSWSLRGTFRTSAQGPLSAEGWPAVSDDSILSEAPSSRSSPPLAAPAPACRSGPPRGRFTQPSAFSPLHSSVSRSPGWTWVGSACSEGHSPHPARQYPRPMFWGCLHTHSDEDSLLRGSHNSPGCPCAQVQLPRGYLPSHSPEVTELTLRSLTPAPPPCLQWPSYSPNSPWRRINS